MTNLGSLLRAPKLSHFSDVMFGNTKLDFTKYGHASKEWKDFSAANPVDADTESLPDDTADTAHPELPEYEPEAAALGLSRSIDQKNDARCEEVVIRPDEDKRLTAFVYTKILDDDDLQLDDPLPCVVYFHSGGYGLLGKPSKERGLCSQMAARLRVVVVHIFYRETPPHQHPDAHDDSRDGLEWVIDHADELGIDRKQIVLAGMCFGAGLAVSVCLRALAREKKVELKGLLLGLPWLYQETMFPYEMFAFRGATSRYQCAAAPLMSKRVYDDLQRQLRITDETDPLLNVPLARDEDLARFPRTAFIVAGMDLLRDDGILFAERLRGLGVPRRVHTFPGMPHAFRRYGELWSSKRFDQVLMLLVNWALERTTSADDCGVHIEEPADKSKQQSQFSTYMLDN